MLKIIFSFILTGVVGTWITYFWQTQNWKRQQEFFMKSKNLEKQIEIIQSLSNLINKRRYRMMRANYALKSNDKERIKKSWEDYDLIVFEWNDNVGTYIVNIREYFNVDASLDFENNIMSEINNLGRKLEELKKEYDLNDNILKYKERFNKIDGDLRGYSNATLNFMAKLWIFSENHKKQLNGNVEISLGNKKYLSAIYLFKHLFVLRH